MKTIWGESDYKKEYAEGITFYGTPSHGGFYLAPDKLGKINPVAFSGGEYESFRNNRRAGWFEEDCDWAFVALAFPELFPSEEIEAAKNTLANFYPEAL